MEWEGLPVTPGVTLTWVGAVVASTTFTDVTTEVGLSGIENLKFEHSGAHGGGVGALDYDGDGRFDLVLARADLPNLLLRNTGGAFEAVEDDAVAAADGSWIGVSAADVDGDGWPDLLLLGVDGSRLLRNKSGEGFEEVPGTGLADAGWPTHSAAWGDFDRDGDLDLYTATHARYPEYFGGGPPEPDLFPDDVCVGNHLYLQVSPWVFSDHGATLGVDSEGCTLAVTASDLDQDGWLDVYAANDFGAWVRPDLLAWNTGTDPEGELQAFLPDPQVAPAHYGMCAAPGDLDRDDDLDLFLSNTTANRLYASQASQGDSRGFVEVSVAAGIPPVDPQVAWSCAVQDFDHDGWPDIWTTNTQDHTSLYWNQGSRDGLSFVHDTTAVPLEDPAKGAQFGGVSFDFDDDGDLDLVTCGLGGLEGRQEGDTCYVYRNDLETSDHWLQVLLEPAYGSPEPIGAVVELQAGEQTWRAERSSGVGYASSAWPVLHFGLGNTSVIDEVIVTWPDGMRQTWWDVAVDQRIVLTHEVSDSGAPEEEAPPTCDEGQRCCGCSADPRGSKPYWGFWPLLGMAWLRRRQPKSPSTPAQTQVPVDEVVAQPQPSSAWK